MGNKIKQVKAREILSAGAFPTVETEITLEDGKSAKASVPFGSSAGSHEAINILDNDKKRYNGLGVLTAVNNVNNIITPRLLGMDVTDQKKIDALLNELDDTDQKEKLGGNSILSVSLAAIRAASVANDVPLYKQTAKSYGFDQEIKSVPKPMMVVIEGGAHADDSTDFQEYLISVVANDLSTKDKVRAGVEIYHSLKEVLKNAGFNTNVGLEGAFAPTGIESNTKPLDFIYEAITKSGYKERKQVAISLDTAASEFYKKGKYNLQLENESLGHQDLINYYQKLIEKYPIYSIEDGLSEDDWDSWSKLKEKLGSKIKIVGDDLTVTNKERLQTAIEKDAINAIIIKPNQVGTLTETIETIKLAKENDIELVVSHRGGGETIDTFIIDLAIAAGASFVKVGPSRGERVVKYNRLMEIATELNL